MLRRNRWKWAILSLSIFFFISSFAFFVIYGLLFRCPQNQTICRTDECVISGSQILKKLNREANPCEDFYEFACGRYFQDEPIPSDEDVWSSIQSTTDALLFIVQRLLQTEQGNITDATTKAKIFFETCMRENRVNDEEAVSAIHKYLSEAGVADWPILDPHWNRNDINMEKRLAVLIAHQAMPFFDMKLSHNSSEKFPNILKITTGRPVLETEFYLSFERDHSIHVQLYREFMFETLRYLKVAEDKAQRDVNDMISFETNFANVTKVQKARLAFLAGNYTGNIPDGGYYYSLSQIEAAMPEIHRTLLESMGNITDHIPEGGIFTVSQLDTMLPEIDWTLLFRYLCDSLNVSDCNINMIKLDSIWSMKHLLRVLENTPRRTLANYMIWRFLYKFMHELHGAFRRLHYDFVQKHLNSTPILIPMWKECSGTVHNRMFMATTSLFIEHVFDAENKVEINNMANFMKKSFIDLVKSQSEISKDQREQCAKMIQNMSVIIGYVNKAFNLTTLNEFYNDMEMKEDHYLTNILRHNKFVFSKKIEPALLPPEKNKREMNSTKPEQNKVDLMKKNISIALPLETLIRPLFGPSQQRYRNYGMAGMFIGHEIMRELTKQGKPLFDSIEKWSWQEENQQNNSAMLNCLGKGFLSNSTANLVQNSKLPASDLYSMRNERIGLDQAYQTYQKYGPKSEPGLPGLNFDNQQMFFILYGQMMCRVKKNEMSAVDNVEGTPQYRVNRVVRSKHFKKAFNCKEEPPKKKSKMPRN